MPLPPALPSIAFDATSAACPPRTSSVPRRIPSLERLRRLATVVVAGALLTTTVVALGESASDAFEAENAVAMDRMMAAMDIRPSHDIDADFAAMMIPHHQGAIDMAVAELRYGGNENLRRIAQEIIVEQQQEISAMRLALDQSLPASMPAPTAAVAAVPRTADVSASAHLHPTK